MYTLIWIVVNLVIVFLCDIDVDNVSYWIIQAIFITGSFLIKLENE